MNQLLSGTSLAAALLLAPQLGLAQTAPQPGAAAGQAATIPPQAMNQLQQAEQSLSQAARQMAATSGTQQSQAAQGVRQALTQLQQAMGQVPAHRRSTESYKALETRVGEAQKSLQDDRPDMARARTAVDAVIIAIPVLRAEVGGTAAATGAAAGGAGAQPAAAGMPLQRVTNLIGTNVVGANGRDAGEVENFLLDRSGNVRAAVVEWGGFLGIGERRAAVPIEQLQFGAPNERVRLDMTREQLEALGGFDGNNLGQYGTRYGWGDGVRLYR